MAENKKRSVQFRRNVNEIYDSNEKVKAEIEKNKDSYYDGEQIFGRYTYSEKVGETTVTKISTLVGLVYVKTNVNGSREVTITYLDSKDIQNQFDEINETIKEFSAETREDIEELSATSVGNVEVEQVTSGKTHQYTNVDADLYNVSATTLTGHTEVDTFQLTYTPYSPSGLTVPTTIGDIERGTKASELNGNTLSKMIDDIIFPTIYPDLKDPTASISTSSTYSLVVELGSAAPSLKVTYTRGTAKVNDGVTTDRNYTGNLTGATFQYIYIAGAANANAGVSASGTTITTPTLLTSTIESSSITTTVGGTDIISGKTSTALNFPTVGTYKFRCLAKYAAGSQLQTSKGDKTNPIRYASLNGTTNTTKATVTNPHPASELATSYDVTTEVSLPIYANSGSTYSNTYKKLPIKAWGAMTISSVEMPTTNVVNYMIIATPRKIKKLYSFNELSGKYDIDQTANITTFTPSGSDPKITTNGTYYFYYKWKGGEVSTRKYQIETY